MLLASEPEHSGITQRFSCLQRVTLTPLTKSTYNFYLDSRKLNLPWQEFLSTLIQQWSSSTFLVFITKLILENNLPAQNQYFQATHTHSSEVQSFASCTAKCLGAAGTRERLVWILIFFYNFRNFLLLDWGRGEKIPSYLHFSSLKKTEESDQYIFQFSLCSTDWSCSSKLN